MPLRVHFNWPDFNSFCTSCDDKRRSMNPNLGHALRPLPPKSMLYCHSRDSPVELCGSATALRLNIDLGGRGVGTESQNCHRYVLKTHAVSGPFNLPEQ